MTGSPIFFHQRCLVIAAALVVAAGGCRSKRDQPADVGEAVHFVAALSMTGEFSRESRAARNGYELCARKVNERGGIRVGRRRLRLLVDVRDDGSRPDTTAQIIERFNDAGYRLVLGPYGSESTSAAAAIVERSGQVMVNALGADDSIFRAGWRRTFNILAPASRYATAMIEAVSALARPPVRSVVFLSADDGFSKTVTRTGEETARRHGMTVYPAQYFPRGTTSVSAALINAHRFDPDLLVGAVHFAEGVSIIRQADELDIRPRLIGETVAPLTSGFSDTLGGRAEGILGASQWVPSVPGRDAIFGGAADYANAYRAVFGDEPRYHAAVASAACLALTLAVERAGTTDPGDVARTMRSLDTGSFFGRIRFDASGVNRGARIVIVQLRKGRAVPVWPPEVAQGHLVWTSGAR